MELEKYVLEDLLKDYIKIDEDKNKYILEDEYNKIQLTREERIFVGTVLKNNNISLTNDVVKNTDDIITKNDRSPYVKDFEYGEHKTYGTRNIDTPVKLKLDYIDELEFVENADELEYFLENEFIPNNVMMKQKKDKETGEIKLYPSIQLNKITALKYSETEVEHIMNYLKEKNIRVCGYSESLDSEFENYDYFRTYKNSILPRTLSKEEINQKFELWRATNDPVIREQLILGNMRIVPWVAFSIANYYGVDSKELEQYGYEYLIDIVEKYDHTLGYTFSTYATAYLRGKLRTAVLEILGVDRASFSFPYLRAKKVVEEMNDINLLDNPEYIEDVVDILIGQGVISENVRDDYIKRIQLLNAKSVDYFDDEENDIVSNFDTDIEATYGILNDNVKQILSTLTDKERKVLILRFGLGDGISKTLSEVGSMFNLSKERIRMIEAKALRKLRHPSRRKKVIDFIKEDKFYAGITESMLDEHVEVLDSDTDEYSINNGKR